MDAHTRDVDATAQKRATNSEISTSALLPARWYTAPEHYGRERERLLCREWIAVGRVDQVARPGSYFTVDLLEELLVVVRGRDNVVRVLSRVCRHRWMPVVQGSGTRNSFQCPYHLWTYGLDGQLLGAPEMHRAEGFDRTQCRLPEVRSEIWEGWIFVNFDSQAAPLGPRLEPLRQVLAPYRLDQMCSTPALVYESRWNWKIMVENFMESYHHIGPHADTLQPLVPGGGTYADDSDGPYAILHNPAGDRSRPFGILPPIAGLSQNQLTEFLVCAVFPFHLFAVNPDSVVYYQIEPHAVDHFTLRIVLCVPTAAVESPSVEQLRAFLDSVHQQDIIACLGVQAGARSRMATPGRLSHLEKALCQFHHFVIARLR